MNRAFQILSAISIIVVSMLTNGCKLIGQKSPSDVVIAAYMAANGGKYSEAEKYLSLSPAVMNAVKGGLVSRVVSNAVWDEITRNGTIEKIEILKEEVRGEGAKVFFRIHFKDGKTKDDYEPLIKEHGRWKIGG